MPICTHIRIYARIYEWRPGGPPPPPPPRLAARLSPPHRRVVPPAGVQRQRRVPRRQRRTRRRRRRAAASAPAHSRPSGGSARRRRRCCSPRLAQTARTGRRAGRLHRPRPHRPRRPRQLRPCRRREAVQLEGLAAAAARLRQTRAAPMRLAVGRRCTACPRAATRLPGGSASLSVCPREASCRRRGRAGDRPSGRCSAWLAAVLKL